MINILSSQAKSPSRQVREVPRKKGEDNLDWLVRNLPLGEVTQVVLLGGKSGETAAMRRDRNRTSKQIEKCS